MPDYGDHRRIIGLAPDPITTLRETRRLQVAASATAAPSTRQPQPPPKQVASSSFYSAASISSSSSSASSSGAAPAHRRGPPRARGAPREPASWEEALVPRLNQGFNLDVISRAVWYDDLTNESNNDVHKRVLARLKSSIVSINREVEEERADRSEEGVFHTSEIQVLAASKFRIKIHALLSIENVHQISDECCEELAKERAQRRILVHFNMGTTVAEGHRAAGFSHQAFNDKPTHSSIEAPQTPRWGEPSPAAVAVAKAAAEARKTRRLQVQLPKFEINIAKWVEEFVARLPDLDSPTRFARRPAAAVDLGASKTPHRERYLLSMLDHVAVDADADVEASDEQKPEKRTIATDYPIDPAVFKQIDAAEPHIPVITKPDMAYGLKVCALSEDEKTYACIPMPYALPKGMQDAADCAMIMEPPIPMYTMADKLDRPETRFLLRHKLMASWAQIDDADSLRRLSMEEVYASLLPASGKTAFQQALECGNGGQALPSVLLDGIVNATLTVSSSEIDWLKLGERWGNGTRGEAAGGAAASTMRAAEWNSKPHTIQDVASVLDGIVDHAPSGLEDEAVASWKRREKDEGVAPEENDPEPTPLPPEVLAAMRRVWQRLEVSKVDQLDFIIKYTSRRYCWRLNDVVRLWSAVAAAMSRYEAGLDHFEAALAVMRSSDPSSIEQCFQRAKALARLDFFGRDALCKLHHQLGEHVLRGKRPILTWLTVQAAECKRSLEETHSA